MTLRILVSSTYGEIRHAWAMSHFDALQFKKVRRTLTF